MASMGPRINRSAGKRVMSEDWNRVQLEAREAIESHAHTGTGERLSGAMLPTDAEVTASRLVTDRLTVRELSIDDVLDPARVAGSDPIRKRLETLRMVQQGAVAGDLEIPGDLEIDGSLEVTGDLVVDGSIHAGRIALSGQPGRPVKSYVTRGTGDSIAIPGRGEGSIVTGPWTVLPGLEQKLELDVPHLALISVSHLTGPAVTGSGYGWPWIEFVILHTGPSPSGAVVTTDSPSFDGRPLATAFSTYHDPSQGRNVDFRHLAHAALLPSGKNVVRVLVRGQAVYPQHQAMVMHILLFRAGPDSPGTASTGGTK